MDSMLAGRSGVVCYMDDMMVHAENEELEQRLRQVFQKFKDRGLTPNRDKYVFGLQKIEILGDVISAEGIQPDPRKTEAVFNTPRADNEQQLRSFLGTWISDDIHTRLRKHLRTTQETNMERT